MAEVVDVQLFGELALTVDGRAVDGSGLARRPRELVQLLAVTPGRRLPRDVVVDALFGHLDAEAGAANLHKAASLARRWCGDGGAVVLDGGMVTLWPGARVTTDLERFEVVATSALADGDPERCRRVADGAGAVGAGAALLPAALGEPWAEAPRRRVARLVADLRRAAGDWAALVEADPTDEEAHRELMRVHAAAGRRDAVIRRYRDLRATLRRELGVPPSPETVRRYEELSRGPAVVAPLARERPLIGRAAAWDRIRDRWDAAAAGRGGGLLLRGEPGIGKTRLAEELLDTAAAAGWSTLRGSASRFEAALPFAPVLEAVDRLLGERPELAEGLDPDARTVLGRLATATRHDDRGGGAPLTHQQVTSVIARLLAAVAREHGLVLLVDDLHAADGDTVTLVHHLTRAATYQRFLVVATFRAGELAGPAAEAVADLVDTRRATEVVVGPLAAADAVELVRSARPGAASAAGAAGAAGDDATAGAAGDAALAERAGGNPFLLLELAAGGAERVTRLLSARIHRLDPGPRSALATVAVAGEEVTAEDLVVLAGLSEDDAAATIAAATGEGILRADADGTVRFRHGLMREAVLHELGAGPRARTHRSIAEALTARGAPAAQVAHHLLASDRPAAALPHLRQAAAAAAALGAYRSARRFVDQAIDLGAADGELLAHRADLAFATGDPSAPVRYAEALAATPPEHHGPLLVRQARAHIAAYDVPAATAALAAARVDAPADRARLHLIEAQVAWMSGDLAACEDLADRARAAALTHGAMDVVFGATSIRDLVLHQQGRWPGGLGADLRDAAGSPVLAAVVHDAHLCGAEADLYGGRPYDEVKAWAADLAATARAAGATRGLAFAVTLLGEAELLSGALDAAADHLSDGARLHASVGAPGGQGLALQRLAEVRLATGHRDDADGLLADALPLARANPALAWHLVARVYGTMVAAAPDPQAAAAVVDEGALATDAGMAQACPPCSIAFAVPAAIACAGIGDVGRARGFVAAAEPWVDALWAQTGWRAALDEARGHVAGAEGDRATAAALLAGAAERFAAVGQPLDAARCRAARADLPSR